MTSLAPVPVLFVLTDLRVGGMERKVAEIVQKMDRTRCRPVVACLKEAGPLAPEVESAGVRVYSRLIAAKWDIRALVRLLRIIRSEGIQVVCTVGDGGDRMFWGRLAARIAGVAGIVSTLHSTRNPSGGRILDRPNRWLTPWNDVYVAVAKSAAEYLIEHEGLPRDRTIAIYNGVDLSKYAGEGREEVRQALEIPLGVPVISHVAAFRIEKAHDVLLRAARKVVDAEPESRFLLVGDGETRGEIEQLRAELGLEENVLLLGYRSDIPEILAASDVFVLCSRAKVETFPNSVLEAMASRRPPVCTNVGSIAEQITDGQNGFLVDEEDWESLADRILALIRDPELRQRMGENAHSVVSRNFSTERMVRDREDLFTSIARGHGIPSRLYLSSVKEVL
ncbi:MAG: glycosyl transferase family 1 [Planctomycetes bacterium]|jgi:glycosyltransferase involved in cell wall biosynthesis|nr:glycosyl transferase family 1 [Planctomycetota bacterium]MDP7245153.1 glycosyltransferase [Planctomycetota bacterium]|tara:strand:+ start:3259 stop:4440 length:1182 start_codon:yes stop_codon:yes gene_type:complete